MAIKNVVLDKTFGNNLSGQVAIDVIFEFTVLNTDDEKDVPRGTMEGPTHFLNLTERKPYYKDAAGGVFEDKSTRAIADEKKWVYDNTIDLIYASRCFAISMAVALQMDTRTLRKEELFILHSTDNDRLSFTINDDLSGLVLFNAFAVGRLEIVHN